MSDFHLFSPKSFQLGRSNSDTTQHSRTTRFEDYESSIDLETASNLRPDSQRDASDGGGSSSRSSNIADSPSVYKTIHR